MGQPGITSELDQMHVEIIVKVLGLEGSNQVATPGVREDGYKDGDEVLLPTEQATKYRGVVARGNYLGQDWTDIQFAVNALSRRMASPYVADERKMKSVGR